MNWKRIWLPMALGAVGCFAAGCSLISSENKAVKLSSIRPPLGSTTVVEQKISRTKYLAAYEQAGEQNQARLVPIFGQGSDWESFPQYRLLDVQPGSVYAILGLKNLDIILGANDFVIPSSQKFWQFLGLVGRYQGATIEIRRDDKPVLMKYEFEQ